MVILASSVIISAVLTVSDSICPSTCSQLPICAAPVVLRTQVISTSPCVSSHFRCVVQLTFKSSAIVVSQPTLRFADIFTLLENIPSHNTVELPVIVSLPATARFQPIDVLPPSVESHSTVNVELNVVAHLALNVHSTFTLFRLACQLEIISPNEAAPVNVDSQATDRLPPIEALPLLVRLPELVISPVLDIQLVVVVHRTLTLPEADSVSVVIVVDVNSGITQLSCTAKVSVDISPVTSAPLSNVASQPTDRVDCKLAAPAAVIVSVLSVVEVNVFIFQVVEVRLVISPLSAIKVLVSRVVADTSVAVNAVVVIHHCATTLPVNATSQLIVDRVTVSRLSDISSITLCSDSFTRDIL